MISTHIRISVACCCGKFALDIPYKCSKCWISCLATRNRRSGAHVTCPVVLWNAELCKRAAMTALRNSTRSPWRVVYCLVCTCTYTTRTHDILIGLVVREIVHSSGLPNQLLPLRSMVRAPHTGPSSLPSGSSPPPARLRSLGRTVGGPPANQPVCIEALAWHLYCAAARGDQEQYTWDVTTVNVERTCASDEKGTA